MRFERDYKGRLFSDCLLFDSVERAVIGVGWHIRFKKGTRLFLHDVSCSTNDDALAHRLVDLNKEEIVHVQGTIDTTIVGTVILRSCNIS